MRKTGMAFAALAVAVPASADVVSSGDSGFTSRHSLSIAAPPAKVWEALVHPERWWQGDHTYSGDAANLSLELRPGGCWCEKLSSGGVEHMRVVYVATGDTLRMVGGLGPLQAMPVTGVMTIILEPGGGGTKLVGSYAVAGQGLTGIAAPVDKVLATQWSRLKAAAER
ncbi:SRPBCC family protein [Sphingomonas sp. DT-207]|uniref:SRPBCC family protein n=1 Tax=Sphingomonas sp. DT-207 TaxID=3396167 RepID=UPI003F1AFA3E